MKYNLAAFLSVCSFFVAVNLIGAASFWLFGNLALFIDSEANSHPYVSAIAMLLAVFVAIMAAFGMMRVMESVANSGLKVWHPFRR